LQETQNLEMRVFYFAQNKKQSVVLGWCKVANDMKRQTCFLFPVIYFWKLVVLLGVRRPLVIKIECCEIETDFFHMKLTQKEHEKTCQSAVKAGSGTEFTIL